MYHPLHNQLCVWLMLSCLGHAGMYVVSACYWNPHFVSWHLLLSLQKASTIFHSDIYRHPMQFVLSHKFIKAILQHCKQGTGGCTLVTQQMKQSHSRTPLRWLAVTSAASTVDTCILHSFNCDVTRCVGWVVLERCCLKLPTQEIL